MLRFGYILHYAKNAVGSIILVLFALAPIQSSAATTTPVPGYGYVYGSSTYYVATRLPSIPSDWGNASAWRFQADADGYYIGVRPIKGAIAWTNAGPFGHVAIVEAANGNTIVVSEMNNGIVVRRIIPASYFQCYIYMWGK